MVFLPLIDGLFTIFHEYLLVNELSITESILQHSNSILFFRLRSSLWLQFKPHHIAAGAAFLAAQFLNLDLAYYQGIWHEFQTTPSILQGTVTPSLYCVSLLTKVCLFMILLELQMLSSSCLSFSNM